MIVSNQSKLQSIFESLQQDKNQVKETHESKGKIIKKLSLKT
jgi:hypothetical protein